MTIIGTNGSKNYGAPGGIRTPNGFLGLPGYSRRVSTVSQADAQLAESRGVDPLSLAGNHRFQGGLQSRLRYSPNLADSGGLDPQSRRTALFSRQAPDSPDSLSKLAES